MATSTADWSNLNMKLDKQHQEMIGKMDRIIELLETIARQGEPKGATVTLRTAQDFIDHFKITSIKTLDALSPDYKRQMLPPDVPTTST